jgi:hypothetical protein
MKEKSIETKQKEVNVEKKAYTPPSLVKYGKLSELTAGGSSTAQESHPDPSKRRP